jgi:hypothetical protein
MSPRTLRTIVCAAFFIALTLGVAAFSIGFWHLIRSGL